MNGFPMWNFNITIYKPESSYFLADPLPHRYKYKHSLFQCISHKGHYGTKLHDTMNDCCNY